MQNNYIPAWLHTSPGNPNCCENQLNVYAGSSSGVAETADQVLYVPIHDNTCGTRPADSDPVCPGGNWTGGGDLLHYHIPYWVGFKLDGAFTQGSDVECNELPGTPFSGWQRGHRLPEGMVRLEGHRPRTNQYRGDQPRRSGGPGHRPDRLAAPGRAKIRPATRQPSLSVRRATHLGGAAFWRPAAIRHR